MDLTQGKNRQASLASATEDPGLRSRADNAEGETRGPVGTGVSRVVFPHIDTVTIYSTIADVAVPISTLAVEVLTEIAYTESGGELLPASTVLSTITESKIAKVPFPFPMTSTYILSPVFPIPKSTPTTELSTIAPSSTTLTSSASPSTIVSLTTTFSDHVSVSSGPLNVTADSNTPSPSQNQASGPDISATSSSASSALLTPPTPTATDDNRPLSAAANVCIAIGVAIPLLILVGVLMWRRRRNPARKQTPITRQSFSGTTDPRTFAGSTMYQMVGPTSEVFTLQAGRGSDTSDSRSSQYTNAPGSSVVTWTSASRSTSATLLSTTPSGEKAGYDALPSYPPSLASSWEPPSVATRDLPAGSWTRASGPIFEADGGVSLAGGPQDEVLRVDGEESPDNGLPAILPPPYRRYRSH